MTPDDAGLAWAVGKTKRDFVGKRSLCRPAMQSGDRKQVVGLLTRDSGIVLEEGAQIVADARQPIPMTMLGHVTSAYWSETLGRSIALALVRDGRERIGSRLFASTPGGTTEVEVVSSIFYDPKGVKLDA